MLSKSLIYSGSQALIANTYDASQVPGALFIHLTLTITRRDIHIGIIVILQMKKLRLIEVVTCQQLMELRG